MLFIVIFYTIQFRENRNRGKLMGYQTCHIVWEINEMNDLNGGLEKRKFLPNLTSVLTLGSLPRKSQMCVV